MAENKGALVRRTNTWVILSVTAAMAFAFTVASLAGVRWFITETPSMGTAGPVGSLVVSAPTPFDALRAGDVITFRPPTNPNEVYTHRISTRTASELTTRGDLNPTTDPWRLTQADIIGSSILLPGAGWLVEFLPYLAIASMIAVILRPQLSPPLRGPTWLICTFLALTAFLTVVRPIGQVELISATTTNTHTDAYIVSTSLLPINVQALPPAPEHNTSTLNNGQTAHLHAANTPNHHYNLHTTIALPPSGWALLLLLCSTCPLTCLNATRKLNNPMAT
ncbi:hypothetical protein IT072_20690 (plasmid) [Leifsonia sp. ZF2019]|uniref:hypothetical protein n=1 Tax=Leifsonia sp. ZF2019 TaxID=2781978 RepID=UPI001CC12CC7|nr:hypothetical protein [Leifsonia sp. ZF2019]UAJ81766.1 hypothetical protein IT072_20690 [Leifsonia sp. ZF2019]